MSTRHQRWNFTVFYRGKKEIYCIKLVARVSWSTLTYASIVSFTVQCALLLVHVRPHTCLSSHVSRCGPYFSENPKCTTNSTQIQSKLKRTRLFHPTGGFSDTCKPARILTIRDRSSGLYSGIEGTHFSRWMCGHYAING